jgi:hypothetical protein
VCVAHGLHGSLLTVPHGIAASLRLGHRLPSDSIDAFSARPQKDECREGKQDEVLESAPAGP